MNRIIYFLKYHNLVPIILGVVLLATAGAFASEDVRNTVIGEKVVNEEGIDNYQILAVDLDNFNFALQVDGISQDESNYYVNYIYQTMAIQDNIWQPVLKSSNLNISKAALGDEDLGLYVEEELSEVTDYELRYLREVQLLEREKGITKLTAAIDYTGLIGLVLDAKNKIFPAYESVERQLVSEGTPTYYSTSTDDSTFNVDLPPDAGGEVSGVEAMVCQNGASRSCSSEVGVCQVGVEICEQGVWGECIGAKFPSDEICDRVDNDCDGEIDEGNICSGVSISEVESPKIDTNSEILTPADPITIVIESVATNTESIIIEILPEATTTE